MDKKEEAVAGQSKSSLDTLSKEELLQKYKGLLGIAKKAKQAKDELSEENRKLKEALLSSETQKDADKQALLTMKEMLEEFTEQKLQLTIQLSEIQKKSKLDEEMLGQLHIENESLKRQLDRLNEDNETLLNDIDRMENQLKQVNLLGMEQKKHLGLLELEVNKLKDAESLNSLLQSTVSVTQEENKALKEQENNAKHALEELMRKYSHVKEINTEQRHKFNALKDRFVEVHRKLKNLKECKRVLLETQHEYAEAVSNWQKEIIKASHMLCAEMSTLKTENEELLRKLKLRDELIDTANGKVLGLDIGLVAQRLQEMQALSEVICKEINEKELQLAAAEKENVRLQQEISAFYTDTMENKTAADISQFQLETKCLMQELTDLKTKLQDYKEKLHMSCTARDDLEAENNELKEIVSTLKQEQHVLKEQNSPIHYLKADNQRLKEEMSQMAEKMKDSNKVYEDLQQIRDILKALEDEKVQLLEQIKQQEKEHQQQDKNSEEKLKLNYDELQARFSQKEREHSDLLSEMRELNEALKTRGDVISRQREKQQELMNELRSTNSKLIKIDEELKQKEQTLARKEEQAHEITEEIGATRQKIRELETACMKGEEQIRLLNEELHSLRNNVDAQSEVMSTSTISRADEISRLREVDESFEDKYNKLRGLAVKLKKKVQDQTAYVAEMEQQLVGHTALKHELDENCKQLTALQKTQEEYKQQIDSLKVENAKMKSSRKQTNVLSLEIEAAEKSLSEATLKLAAKSNEVESLNEVLSSKEHTIKQLRKEIFIVESAKTAECAHAKELKEQVDHLQEKLKDTVHEKQEAQLINKRLEQSHEQLKQELEALRLEIIQSANKTESILVATQNEKEHILQKLIETESKLSVTQAKLSSVERTLEGVRAEFVEYKVKAQAVLRKNQNKDTSHGRELEAELIQLRTAEQQARSNAALKVQELTENQKLAEELRVSNETLQRRTQELMTVVEDMQHQNNTLTQENRAHIFAQQESLKTHREQLDAMESCHKQQMHDLKANYQRQFEQLRIEHERTARLPPVIGENAVSNINVSNISQSEQSKIEFLLMEREDAEGSEAEVTANNHGTLRKISTSSRRSQHDFMPLDELLNVPMHTFSETVTTISGNNFGRNNNVLDANANDNTDALNIELQSVKELLQKQESRVRHLTSLLAENEQDLAKLTQMNDMLKEELRRQERSVEREQHMHNSEYLKNVILKFLTLNSGDERVRLVPVINTILKLSRNESELLNCVAKGQKLPGESQGRNWSFLPIWSSSGANSNN